MMKISFRWVKPHATLFPDHETSMQFQACLQCTRAEPRLSVHLMGEAMLWSIGIWLPLRSLLLTTAKRLLSQLQVNDIHCAQTAMRVVVPWRDVAA